jgi:DNA-binding MarR family transcriptional regulator
VCLRVIGQAGVMSPSHLAQEVSLSQGTITGIVDRLVSRQLVERERRSDDRRAVTLRVTDAGRALIAAAPSPLQERFVQRLAELSMEEREIIRLTLNKIVRMMDGDAISAAPVLTNEEALSSPAESEPGLEPSAAPVDPAPRPRGHDS